MARMLLIGTGPGPKNVLVECDDGSKRVVAYRTWKYRYAPTAKRSNYLAEAQYRTFTGVVQFDPREGQAGGKDVRNITIRNSGVKENSMKVGATLWPSHAHVAVEKGDVVVLEGKFSRNQGTNQNGDSVTYNNLSVSAIRNLGPMDFGTQVDVENQTSTPVSDDSDDDIPF